jgi:hypothetical protein
MSDTDERAQGAVIALVLGEDERGELERLRQEVAALGATATPRLRRRIRWASVAAAVLLVLGCVGCPGLGGRGVDAQPAGRCRPLRGDDESGDPGPGGPVCAHRPDPSAGERRSRDRLRRSRSRVT